MTKNSLVVEVTFKQLARQTSMLQTLMQKNLVQLRVKSFTFSILNLLKLNFSTTVFGATSLCTTVFRADTGNNRKIANFTYSYLCARPIKVENAKQLLSNF